MDRPAAAGSSPELQHMGSPPGLGLWVDTIAGSTDAPLSYAYVPAQPFDGVGSRATFRFPRGMAASPDGVNLFVADSYSDMIRSVDITTGVVSTIAGSANTSFADGTGSMASFRCPSDVAISNDGKRLFVADDGHHRVRTIDIETRIVRTLAGNDYTTNQMLYAKTSHPFRIDGVGTSATFMSACPSGQCPRC